MALPVLALPGVQPLENDAGGLMAGDWIKVEQATLDKPEILRAAEMLGLSRRETVGLFIEFWVWLDKNLSASCPDSVRNMSRKSLDHVLHCDGFASTLEVIGWAKFDDAGAILTIPNADRHNGTPAKTRALDAKRKREARSGNVPKMSASKPDVSGTREEKRREVIPDAACNSLPSASHQTLAAELGVNCKYEWDKFRDHEWKGKPPKDVSRAFRNWLRNARSFAVRDGTLAKPGQPRKVAL